MTENPVFVTGIWKSGNHLVYSALNELGIQGPFNGIAAHLLFGRGKTIKRLLRGSASGIDVGLETEARVRPCYIRHSLRKLRGKIIGGHAAFSPDLLALLRAESAHMIVIRRDPRDILVSFADWIRTRPDFYLHAAFAPLGREACIRLLLRGGENLAGGYRLKPFSEVLDRAEGWLDAAGVLQVRFEDLIGARGGGSEARQAQALQSIHALVGSTKPLQSVDPDAIYGGSLTFNKGRAARWRELDDPALIEDITQTLGPRLARWGYEA
jgi:hypothetical protein